MEKSNLLIRSVTPELRWSPVIEFGIPKFRPGSVDEGQWYDEQIDRCLYGYKPERGEWIPPNYYHHLNFWKLSRRRFDFDPGRGNKTNSYPFRRDVDSDIIFPALWESHKICAARQGNGGKIFGKRRRIGITDDFTSDLYWETAFFPENSVFVGTPTPKSLANIRAKFKIGHGAQPPQMFENMLIDNKNEILLGVEDNLPEGIRRGGLLSSINWQVFTNSGVFKSGWASFALFDEIGEFGDNPSLIDCYMETVDCFKEGDDWIGFPVLAGTTDVKNMKNTHFMEMWNNASAFNLEKVFIPADYYFGDKYFDMSTGKSDRKKAEKRILERRKELETLSNKTPLLQYTQNNPLNEGDMFLIMGNNGLNMKRINDQIRKVNESVELSSMGQRGNIMPVKSPKKGGGTYWTAEWFPTLEGRWFKSFEPINHLYPGADITAVDDYFKDDAPFSESLGGIITWRRPVLNSNIISRIPVLTYLERPPKLDDFHEDCLLQCVFTNSRAAIEYHNEGFKKYFLNHTQFDGSKYLKVFPRVSGKVSSAADAYGYPYNTNEEVNAMGYAKKWVDSPHIENCIDLQFLRQIATMGTSNADLGSAWKIALLYEADMSTLPVKSVDEIEEVKHTTGLMQMGDNGIPVMKKRNTFEQRQREFKKMSWMNTLNR